MGINPSIRLVPTWHRAVAWIGAASLIAGLAATGAMVPSADQAACSPGLAAATAQTVSGGGYQYERGFIRSFDCTPIVFNLFLPNDAGPTHRVYTILEGPGWGGPGATTPDANLIADDYAELTWDPRGFGQSGGVAEVDSPDAEGRDVSALITDVLAGSSPFAPEIAVDSEGATPGQPLYTNDPSVPSAVGQPAVGMTGVSYGGGIEFATAAFDPRVKAMAPGWAWNDLDYSLFPGGVIKLGWDELLFAVGVAEGGATHLQGDVQGLSSGAVGGTAGLQTGGYDPNLVEAEAKGAALGYADSQTQEWFRQRSMIAYGVGGDAPDIPTLLIQGTVDTLFNVNEAWANAQEIVSQHPGLPVKMIAFCGGHVSCPTGASPQGAGYSDTASSSSPVAPGESASAFTENATLAWFDTYLRGFSALGTPNPVTAAGLPPVAYQDQNGDFHAISVFPTMADAPSLDAASGVAWVSAPVAGTLVSHGLPTGVAPVGETAVVTDGATASGDPGQVTVPVFTSPAASATQIVGEPHLALTVTVAGSSTNLFFRLIDAQTGQVVDLQTAAVRLDNLDLADNLASPNLPPQAESVSLDLVGVEYLLPAGDSLELQVSTSTVSMTPNRGTALVSLSGTVSVPTAPGS